MRVGSFGNIPSSVRDLLATEGHQVVPLAVDLVRPPVHLALAEGRNLAPAVDRLREEGVPVFCSSPGAELLMLSRLALNQALQGAHVLGCPWWRFDNPYAAAAHLQTIERGVRMGLPGWTTEGDAQTVLSEHTFLTSGTGKLCYADSPLPIAVNLSGYNEEIRAFAYHNPGPVILEDTKPLRGRTVEEIAWLADGASISPPVAISASEHICAWASDYVAAPLVRFMRQAGTPMTGVVSVRVAVDTSNPLSVPPLVMAIQTGFSVLVLGGASLPAGFSNIGKGGKEGFAGALRACAQGVLGSFLTAIAGT